MADDRAHTGTVIRDGQGNYYLIKEETLAQSKITDPALVTALDGMMGGGDTKGYAEPVGRKITEIGGGFSALRVTPLLRLRVC